VGLAAAIALRLRGVDVLVVDRARPPIDKPCGEGFMPDGVTALDRLGIMSGLDWALPFRGIRFTEASAAAEGRFKAGYGLGIRRIALHQHLIDRAAQIGVAMRWGDAVRVVDRAGSKSVRAGFRVAGWLARMAANHRLGNGRAYDRQKRPGEGSGCGSISASRHGPIWSKCTGMIAAKPSSPH